LRIFSYAQYIGIYISLAFKNILKFEVNAGVYK